MKFVRAILVILGFICFGIGAFIIGAVLFPIVKLVSNKDNQKKRYAKIIHNAWKFFIKHLEFIGIIKLNIKDKEKLFSIRNKVIVATHPSFIDVVILGGLIPNSICFAKKELLNNFFMKNIVESICIPNGLELDDMQKVTKNFLDKGYNIIIFPAGGRHKKEEQPKIRKGAALVAINANKNIVPIQMYTDYDFLQIGQPIYDAGKRPINYYITPLNEINITDYKDDEVTSRKAITKAIANALYMNVE